MAAPLIVIPARLAATRLPNKPLADIHGTPMVVHVWRRAMEARLGTVLVACDDARIADVVRQAGGEAIITAADHPSGSDRVWEAVQRFDTDGVHDTIINLQGDLPTLPPALVAAVAEPLRDPSVDIATLAAPITDAAEISRPSVVKPVIAFTSANEGHALYFSRAAVPHGEGGCYHHIGIYAYRREALQRFVSLKPSPLELREKLEQLRALENGMRIGVRVVDTVPLGVDTPEDLEQARKEITL